MFKKSFTVLITFIFSLCMMFSPIRAQKVNAFAPGLAVAGAGSLGFGEAIGVGALGVTAGSVVVPALVVTGVAVGSYYAFTNREELLNASQHIYSMLSDASKKAINTTTMTVKDTYELSGSVAKDIYDTSKKYFTDMSAFHVKDLDVLGRSAVSSEFINDRSIPFSHSLGNKITLDNNTLELYRVSGSTWGIKLNDIPVTKKGTTFVADNQTYTITATVPTLDFWTNMRSGAIPFFAPTISAEGEKNIAVYYPYNATSGEWATDTGIYIGTGVKSLTETVSVPIPKVNEWDESIPLTIPKEVATTMNPAISVDKTGTVSVPKVAEGTLDFSPLNGVGSELKKVFPFCIPWDLFNAFKSLASNDKEAPKWSFDMSKFTGGDELTIDFSQFTPLARIVRYLLLLLFSISLIVLTKRILK